MNDFSLFFSLFFIGYVEYSALCSWFDIFLNYLLVVWLLFQQDIIHYEISFALPKSFELKNCWTCVEQQLELVDYPKTK